jgi:hypothetical protein
MKDFKKDINNFFICEECNNVFKYKKGLSKHLTYTHKISQKEYYDKWLKINEDKCQVCKKKTDFLNFSRGYRKLCDNCINLSKFPSNIEYWIYHGFKKEESLEKVKEFQISQCKKVKKHSNDATLEYWSKKGYFGEEAKLKIKNRQSTFTLKKCIEKYGEIEGILRWKNRQILWQKTLQSKSPEEKKRINQLKGITLENMIRKYGEIDGTEKYNDWKISLSGRGKSISTISQELFFKILEKIKDKENVKFGKHNKEFLIKHNKKIFYYDFKYKNNIIEFNGDLFHANPNIFKEEDFPDFYHRDRSAKQIWKLDKFKLDLLTNKRFNILIIWEKEYKENKNKEIEKCLQFLNLKNDS